MEGKMLSLTARITATRSAHAAMQQQSCAWAQNKHMSTLARILCHQGSWALAQVMSGCA